MKTQRFDKEHLKRVREAKGFSVSEFILMLHDQGLTLSRPTYDKYENTGDDLDVKDLEIIARTLSEPLDNFFIADVKVRT